MLTFAFIYTLSHLVCILFGMPSLHLLTFLMFFFFFKFFYGAMETQVLLRLLGDYRSNWPGCFMTTDFCILLDLHGC